MSWEDDLASARGPAPPLSGRPTSSAGRRADDADRFSDRAGAAPAAAAAASSSSAMSASDRAADLDSMLSSPLMSPPVFGGPALAGAMRHARENAAERAALRAALFQTQSEDQERRAAIQAAQGGEIEEAEQALANSSSPQKPKRKPGELIQPLPPLPTLTELQEELLAQVSQSDPPPKVVEFAPLEERLQTWFETNAELSEQAAESQLKVLLKQYRDTREQAAKDSKRIWTTNQHLHAMSMKLAAITQLKDFDALDTPATAGGNATAATVAADTHFYDLHTLDLDSYADIKHLHRSSIASGPSGAGISIGSSGGTGSGWWRTQLRELDEDLSEKRRRDKQILHEIENPVTDDGYEVPAAAANSGSSPSERRQPLMERLNGGAGITRAARRSSARHTEHERENGDGMLLARNRLADEAELEADLLASDLRASGLARDDAEDDRPSKQQLLARTQGRSYRSSSTATEVLLPSGQRLMRHNPAAAASKADPEAPQTAPSRARAIREMEKAMEQEDMEVNKPARRQR